MGGEGMGAVHLIIQSNVPAYKGRGRQKQKGRLSGDWPGAMKAH